MHTIGQETGLPGWFVVLWPPLTPVTRNLASRRLTAAIYLNVMSDAEANASLAGSIGAAGVLADGGNGISDKNALLDQKKLISNTQSRSAIRDTAKRLAAFGL